MTEQDDAFECARAALFVASDHTSIRHILDVLRDRLAALASIPAAAQADAVSEIDAILYQCERGNVSLPRLIDALRGIKSRVAIATKEDAAEAPVASEPEGVQCLRCGFVTYIQDGESPSQTTHKVQTQRTAHLSLATPQQPAAPVRQEREPLTDEQIAAALQAWFCDDGNGTFENRMRSAITAATDTKKAP